MMMTTSAPRLSVICPHCGAAVFIALDWDMMRSGHRKVYYICGNCGQHTSTEYELVAKSKGTKLEDEG